MALLTGRDVDVEVSWMRHDILFWISAVLLMAAVYCWLRVAIRVALRLGDCSDDDGGGGEDDENSSDDDDLYCKYFHETTKKV